MISACSFEYIIILDSSMVERTAVNRDVVGSSPTRGVKKVVDIIRRRVCYNFFVRLHGQAVKTPPFHGGNRGSNPLGVIYIVNIEYADMAQLAEELICNQQVIGSSPIVGLCNQSGLLWTFSSVG